MGDRGPAVRPKWRKPHAGKTSRLLAMSRLTSQHKKREKGGCAAQVIGQRSWCMALTHSAELWALCTGPTSAEGRGSGAGQPGQCCFRTRTDCILVFS